MTASQRRPSSAVRSLLRSPTSFSTSGKRWVLVRPRFEEGDPVAAGERVAHDVRPDEAGAAEDEDAHGLLAAAGGAARAARRGQAGPLPPAGTPGQLPRPLPRCPPAQ